MAIQSIVSEVSWDSIVAQFPAFARWAERRGVDGEDLIVAPAVHYQLSGFVVSEDGSTRWPGLYLAGELTGGVHGANRLMGMGLTKSLVEGWVSGNAAGKSISGEC